MLNILIPTMPDDTHAIQVQLAMQEKGHRALLWHTADFPRQQTHSFEIKDNQLDWTASGKNLNIHDTSFDIVWYRRPRAPSLSIQLPTQNKKNSERENQIFFQNVWSVIEPNAFWINPAQNAQHANSKSLQLKIAMEVGLMIPDTLISNNAIQIKAFLKKNGKNHTVYKTFCALAWQPASNLHLAYATAITLDSLPEDNILESTAGIFQKKIKKAFELRVTYFGTHPVCAKLRSKTPSKNPIDSRAIPKEELLVEPFEIPNYIDEKCQALMEKFGLVFGCFDFIVTPDNEYYFLEINEQGQFLWVEERNADIKMLDTFTEFLINKNKTFKYKPNKNALSIASFKDNMFTTQARAMREHILPPLAW